MFLKHYVFERVFAQQKHATVLVINFVTMQKCHTAVCLRGGTQILHEQQDRDVEKMTTRAREETHYVSPYQMVSTTDLHVFKARIDELIKEGYVLYGGPNVFVDAEHSANFAIALLQ